MNIAVADIYLTRVTAYVFTLESLHRMHAGNGMVSMNMPALLRPCSTSLAGCVAVPGNTVQTPAAAVHLPQLLQPWLDVPAMAAALLLLASPTLLGAAAAAAATAAATS